MGPWALLEEIRDPKLGPNNMPKSGHTRLVYTRHACLVYTRQAGLVYTRQARLVHARLIGSDLDPELVTQFWVPNWSQEVSRPLIILASQDDQAHFQACTSWLVMKCG